MQAIWIITRKGSGKFVGAFEYEHDAVAMKEALQDHDAAGQDNRDLEVSWVWLQSATQPAAPQEGSINPEYHECDEDIESGLCRICHVEMTAPCPTCGGLGFHAQPCAALPSR